MNKLSSLVVAVGLLFANSASAAVHTYEFGGAPINGTGNTSAINFATLIIDDVTNLFTLSLGNLAALGPNAMATGLAVSYSGSIPAISNVSGGVAAVNTTNAPAPAGAFSFGFNIGAGGNQPQSMLTSGEMVTWNATDFNLSQLTTVTPINALNFYGGSFALRIQGTGQGSDGNGWYGGTIAAVPEPETYAMMLAGLGLIGFVGMRRREKSCS